MAAECAEIRMEKAEVVEKMTEKHVMIDTLEKIYEQIDMQKNSIRGSAPMALSLYWVIDLLKREESAEASEEFKPVTHGGFKTASGRKYPTKYRCGFCMRPIPAKGDNYCPHCGRKVDWRDT